MRYSTTLTKIIIILGAISVLMAFATNDAAQAQSSLCKDGWDGCYDGDVVPWSNGWGWRHGPYSVEKITSAGELFLRNSSASLGRDAFNSNLFTPGTEAAAEIRTKVHRNNHSKALHPFFVLANGTYTMTIGFNKNSVRAGPAKHYRSFELDTANYHIYRLELIGNQAFVYVDGQLLHQYTADASKKNHITFGTGCIPCVFDWTIDYIYWKNGELDNIARISKVDKKATAQ